MFRIQFIREYYSSVMYNYSKMHANKKAFLCTYVGQNIGNIIESTMTGVNSIGIGDNCN